MVLVCAARRDRRGIITDRQNRTAEEKNQARLWSGVSGPEPRFDYGGVSMDQIDALWYGPVTLRDVLEQTDAKQLDLGRLIARSMACNV